MDTTHPCKHTFKGKGQGLGGLVRWGWVLLLCLLCPAAACPTKTNLWAYPREDFNGSSTTGPTRAPVVHSFSFEQLSWAAADVTPRAVFGSGDAGSPGKDLGTLVEQKPCLCFEVLPKLLRGTTFSNASSLLLWPRIVPETRVWSLPIPESRHSSLLTTQNQRWQCAQPLVLPQSHAAFGPSFSCGLYGLLLTLVLLGELFWEVFRFWVRWKHLQSKASELRPVTTGSALSDVCDSVSECEPVVRSRMRNRRKLQFTLRCPEGRLWLQRAWWPARPARRVGSRRLTGVRNVVGLGGLWRLSPARSCSAVRKLQLRFAKVRLRRRQRRAVLSLLSLGLPPRPVGATSEDTVRDVLLNQLKGGRGRRKPKTGSNNDHDRAPDNPDEDSLADALTSFLDKWAKKPARSRESPRPAGTPERQPSLCEVLLSVLKKCKQSQASDEATFQQVKSALTKHKQSSKQTGATEKPQTVHRQVVVTGSSPNAVQDRGRGTPPAPNKPSPSPAPVSRAPSQQGRQVLGINSSEWTNNPIFLHRKTVLEVIQDGRMLEGNCTAVQSTQELLELQDTWLAFDCKQPLTVLATGEARGSRGCCLARASLRRGPLSAGFSCEEVGVLVLGEEGYAPKLKPASKVALSKFKAPAKALIRIVAPSHYRACCKESRQWDSPQAIVSEMAQWKVEGPSTQASSLTGGNWQWTKHKGSDQLIGHLKVSESLAQALAPHSGRRGIFISLIKDLKTPARIGWTPKHEDEEPDDYLSRCSSFASARGASLKYRCGGGNDLGVVRKDGEAEEVRAVVVNVRAPKDWEAEGLLAFLLEQKWLEPQVLNKRGQSWLVKGTPPHPASTWRYIDAEDPSITVHVTKAQGKPPSVRETVPLRAPRAKLSEVSARPAEQRRGRAPPDAATGAGAGPRAGKDTQEIGSDRARSRSREKDTTESSKAPPLAPVFDPMTDALSSGWKIRDLGGDGDCGFRSLSGAMHHAKGTPFPDDVAVDQARCKGATIRTQCLSHIRKHVDRYAAFLQPDVDGGDMDTEDLEMYLGSMAHPRAWIDGIMIQAAAEKYGQVVVIWHKSKPQMDAAGLVTQANWQRTTLAPDWAKDGMPKMAKDKSPIVLRLENEHYTYMVPPEGSEVPLAWLRETSVPHRRLLQGSAGPGSEVSVATPSLHSLRSCLDRRQGATHSGSAEDSRSLSAATPSVYTVAKGPLQASPKPSKSRPEASEGSRPRKSRRVEAFSTGPHSPGRGKPSFGSAFSSGSPGCKAHSPSECNCKAEVAPEPSLSKGPSTPSLHTFMRHAAQEAPKPQLDPAASLEPPEVPPRRRLKRKQHPLGEDEDTGHEPLTFSEKSGHRKNRISTVSWPCPLCKAVFTWTGHDKALSQKQRHMKLVHNTRLSAVGGSKSDKMKDQWEKNPRQFKSGAEATKKALLRAKQLKDQQRHDLAHATSMGLFPCIKKTWFCRRCLVKGNTRQITDKACEPEEWGWKNGWALRGLTGRPWPRPVTCPNRKLRSSRSKPPGWFRTLVLAKMSSLRQLGVGLPLERPSGERMRGTLLSPLLFLASSTLRCRCPA